MGGDVILMNMCFAELPIKVLLMLMFTLYSFSALRHLHRYSEHHTFSMSSS